MASFESQCEPTLQSGGSTGVGVYRSCPSLHVLSRQEHCSVGVQNGVANAIDSFRHIIFGTSSLYSRTHRIQGVPSGIWFSSKPHIFDKRAPPRLGRTNPPSPPAVAYQVGVPPFPRTIVFVNVEVQSTWPAGGPRPGDPRRTV